MLEDCFRAIDDTKLLQVHEHEGCTSYCSPDNGIHAVLVYSIFDNAKSLEAESVSIRCWLREKLANSPLVILDVFPATEAPIHDVLNVFNDGETPVIPFIIVFENMGRKRIPKP